MMKRVLYISNGNIPARSANSIQQMKMAQAFGKRLPRFALVIAGGVRNEITDSDLFHWYGISHPFRMIRLPLRWRNRMDDVMTRGTPRYYFKMSGWLTKWKRAALVYTRSPTAAFWTIRNGIDVILEEHNRYNPRLASLAGILHSDRLKGIVCVSAEYAADFADAGFPEDKIFVAGNAVDLDAFATPVDLRERLGIANECVAVYCGSLKPGRGVDLVVAAARRLRQIRFIIAGGRQHDIEAWRTQCREDANITITGYLPNRDIPALLNTADILLLPYEVPGSRTDLTPLKIYEYLAAGKPVVASDIPGLRKYLEQDVTARFCPPGDPETFSDAIAVLAGDADSRRAMGNHAREAARTHSWDHRVSRIIGHYDIFRDAGADRGNLS